MTAIPKDNIIIKELELNRKRLLDLTGRNRLLNYRPSKVKTIEFVNSSFQALYTNLVENERKMAFRSYSPSTELDILAAESVEIDDSYIYVEIKKEELQPKLHKISKMAESFFEEQGYSILFVAIGFISWREQVSEDFQKSPLVLIPVELRRTSIGQPYRLKWTGDEIFSNVCILEKSKELNIEIPEYVSSGDSQSITHYMEEVKQIIEKKGWSLESKCCLDFFSFTKFVLWKDLDINSWAKGSGPQDNELIKATLDSSSENQSAALELKDYNHELDTREIYHILDADPSQIAVIEAVKGGMNLVVEGPPGTGKSQTIANIIAELMGSGKSVLFVSEKMAALEVVKRRLEIAGLGDYCLELHSRKTNKKEFIHTLTKAFMFQEYEEPKIYMGNYTKLENQRKLLNEYAKTISKQIGAKGFSIYELIGLIEHVKRHFDVVGRSYTTITLPHASEINSESWDQVIDELSNITLYAKRIQNIRSFKDNPWKDTDPVFFLRDDIDNFKQKLTKTHTSWLNLNDLLNRLESKFGVVKQNKLNMLDNSLHAASLLENMRSVGKKVFYNKLWESENTKPLSILRNLEKFNNERELIMLDPNITVPAAENRWVEYLSCISIIRNLITFIQSLIKYTNLIYDGTIGQSEDFLSACKSIIDSPFENIDCMLNPKWKDLSLPQKLVDLLAKTQSQYESTKKYFSTAFLDQDNLTVIESFDTLRNSKLRFLNLTFRKARKIIKQHLVDKNSLSSATLSEQLNSAKEYYRLKYELYKYHVDSRLLFDLHWRGLQSDVNILKSIINWQREFIRLDDLGFFSDHTYVIMCDKQKPQELLGIFDRFAELHLSSQQRISDLSRSVSHKSKEEDSYSSLLAAAVRQLKYIRIIKNDPIAKSLYGYLWNSIDTQEDDLLSFLTWRSDFLKAMDEGLLNSKAIDFLDISPHDIIPIQKDYNELKKYHAIVDLSKELFTSLGISPDKLISDKISAHLTRFKQWVEGFSTLTQWVDYARAKKNFNNSYSLIFTSALESGKIADAGDLELIFKASYADTLIKEEMKNNDLLINFNGPDIHEKKIEEFSGLDKKSIELNRLRLISKLRENCMSLKDIMNNSSKHPEAKFLKGEINKKRAHKPIRQILSNAGGLIKQAKPCFLMSPLSIAQYLDPQAISFDTIIFDEASQVRTEDALGALMRGRQLVVMGDSSQLPPTTFFDHIVDEDADFDSIDNPDSSINTESILQQSKKKLPLKYITWHYRSEHESLIQISNDFFYEDRLQVFSSAYAKHPEKGLKFLHLPDTVYDRGKSACNIMEAKKIVELACEHYQEFPDISLGVGAFSVRQQEAILNQLEIKLKDNPHLQHHFTKDKLEPFFVKNLETIQGDERDVIIISVGYGFDQENKLRMSFGPLSQDGGPRRLNVLMTRARKKCIIVSNFKHSDLKVNPQSRMWLKALHAYLQLAELGDMPSARETPETAMLFEESVYHYLKDSGYNVIKQVGCVSFRIDLAITHPDNSHLYVLGILFDGPMYHTSKTARERDRLRNEMLEKLGWKIHRVWSTDWYRDRQKSITQLNKAIDNALQQPVMIISEEIGKTETNPDIKKQ